MIDLCFKSAVEIKRLMQTRDVSAIEVLDAHIARIERYDGVLNAVVTRCFDQARDRAREIDTSWNRDVSPGASPALAGLPIAHKDLVATKGIRTTFGSPLYADNIPDADALIVTRMQAAGAITIGKTNTPEFGAGSQTFNRVFGATANPYDTARTCGGSSGGAAVSLAARFIPIADGSDTGGSLRNPAAFCNVVGFRPSPGRVPSWPSANPWSDLSTQGPMARCVDDVALLFSVLAGPDPRTPCLSEPGSTFYPVEPIDLATLKIGFTEDFGGLPVDRAVRQSLRTFAAQLQDAGATVEEVVPDFSDATRIFHVLRAATFRQRYISMTDAQRAQLKETIRWNFDEGMALTNEDWDWATQARAKLLGRVADLFTRFDLIVGPTTQVQPFSLDTEWVHEIDGHAMSDYIEWMQACSWITVTCCPCLSLPAPFADDLPVGAQLIAPLRADKFLLSAAKAIETATEYAARAPELGD
ncbi:MAG: amidase family protein [Gammaproteobacteria bacterium]|nr:amidase family protein [Gammaproteobacteria bacterium]